MEKLPKRGEVVQLDFVRRERNRGLFCKCKDAAFIIDEENMTVHCQNCDSRIEPFLALLKMADLDQKRNDAMDRLFKQAQELDDYKPHLKVIKMLEGRWKKKELVPLCPSCSEPFLLEELTTWISRTLGLFRINKRQENKKE